MNFREERTLACRGLLVGVVVHSWIDNQSSCGHDDVAIAPAWCGGRRAWLICRRWQPAIGYSAEGTAESVGTFSEGARMLLEQGAFVHLFGGAI